MAPSAIGLASTASTFPFFLVLDLRTEAAVGFAFALAYNLGPMLLLSVQPSLFTRMFAVGVRYTGMSVAYQVSAIAGGFMPLLSLWLLKQADDRPWLVAAFLVIVAAVSFACVSATMVGEPRRQPRHRMVTTASR